MIESVVFNPEALAPERTEVSLHELGLELGKDGVDWGEAQVALQLTRQLIGSTVTDRHLEPVEISLPIVAMEEGDTVLAAALLRLQQLVGSIQADEYEPHWIGRTFSTAGGFSGTVGYLIHSATLQGVQGRALAHNNIASEVVLKALRSPLCYSTVEAESEEFSATDARHLTFELAHMLGTHPGLIRVRVTNQNESGDWNGLICAFECRDHPQDETADTTADLHYEAADLTPKGGAEVVDVGGEDVVEHDSLGAGFITVLGSEINGIGHMTHRGVRRLFIRAEDLGAEAGDVEFLLRSRALGALAWTEHDVVSSTVVDDEQLIDLGEIRIRRAVLGEDRWEFEIQARASSGSGKVRIRDVYPLPDEQLNISTSLGNSQAADAQSTQSPGGVATSGGTGVAWSNPENAKTSNDSRATAEPTPSEITEALVATGFGFEIPEDATITGILVGIERGSDAGGARVADSSITLSKEGAAFNNPKSSNDEWPSGSDDYAFYGGSSDLWDHWVKGGGATQDPTPADVNDATWGVRVRARSLGLGAGKAEVDHIEMTVFYTEGDDDNRVCFATRSVELRSDGVYRQLPSDDVWGEVISEGHLPLAPVEGLEGRKARFIIIPTTGNLDALPDAGTNDLKAQVFIRPGYLFASEAS